MNWPKFKKKTTKPPKALTDANQRIRELESTIRLKDMELEILAQIIERDRERWAAETAIAAKAKVLTEIEEE